jgi:hypothetical protein
MVRPPLYLLLRLDARLALGGLSLAAPSLAFFHPFLPVLRSPQEMRPTSLKRLGVRWSRDDVPAFVLFTVRFLRRGGCESAPVDSRASSREQGPRCASRAGRWEKRDVISELLSLAPFLCSFLFPLCPWVLLRYQLLFLLIPSPLSLCICHTDASRR